jgi:Na+-translocating ferredoxin:NAD+ oxidoreductase RNF subunit RnfB
MPIGILVAIGLACGLIIYLVYLKVPQKVKGLEKTEEITSILPGMNCGACGYPGCFAYAQALSQDPELVTKTPCSQVLQDPASLEQLEKTLGCKLDAAAMCKKALIKCSGNSEVICNYSGAQTCKAAAQLLRGYKKCSYACLGPGDCVEVCPQDAISIDPEKNVAVVDPEKCIGCGLCVTECPQDLIELVPGGTKIAFLCNYKPLKNIPGRERCDFGCIRCRKCFKACEYEAIAWNTETALPEFNQEKCTLCLKCVEVCPQNTLADFTKMGEKREAELVLAK